MSHAALLDLIAGRTRGPLASCARAGLRAAALPYAAAAAARNRAFDLGLRAAHDAGVPVISVGNLTCGGTGKTPITADLCRRLRAAGRRPALLSRGYRTLPGEGANDEKLLLDALLPGVPHVQDPDRVAGARVAVGRHGADCLVLDDGFQHRRLRRDLDVVLIDATAPFGPGSLPRPNCRGAVLPAGLLREPPGGLRRAGLILLTRCDAVTGEERARVAAAVAGLAPGVPVLPVGFPPTGLVNEAGTVRPVSWAKGRRVGAFCGIGNPAGFRATLGRLGVDAATFEPRPDHHRHRPGEVSAICRRAAAAGAAAVFCTEKDLVKLRTAAFRGFLCPLPILAVRVGPVYLEGDGPLRAALAGVLGGAPPAALRRVA